MITSGTTISWKQEIIQGVHSFKDTYKIALFGSEAQLGPTTTVYKPEMEVDGPGYIAGGQELKGFVTGTTKNGSYLTFNSPKWPESTITARGCLIYNASKGNRSVAVFDFGSEVRSINGPFSIDLPTVGENALIRLI